MAQARCSVGLSMAPRPAIVTERGVSRFKCTACESTRCERVTVKRPNGTKYETEFLSCYWCRVMYHHAGPTPVFDPRTTPPSFHANEQLGFSSGLSDEALARIQEAADRVNRSRVKR